ncbi:MAG TPA: tellurite resistance/C4-dicarboxylate transporter family protein [Thermoanaerobaculia bacterium]|jgi:tellurite resistance protein TehA-like permease|nr:tellurite resistance/C4-dicarboxylate transporter family protein [Thermoanaerobaculia bacterium]
MRADSLRGRLSTGVAGLFPGYFALVMATGILSIACQILSWPAIARVLLAVNLLAYVVLVALTIARAVFHHRCIIDDFGNHARGSGFFTLVAGTSVLGTESLLVAGWRSFAEVLLGVGLCLWLVVMYAFFTAVIVREHKPTLAEGINGAWLLATVATQSVAILALGLGDPFGWSRATVAFGALIFFLIGCMLYLAIITLIFYRFTFLELATATLTPPYWINMGAVAITTLAGSLLVLGAERSPLLTEILPFLKGFTLFFWAAGTWWIPLLLLLGGWRHLWKRYPLTYDPQYWGMVFPLGMYTVATYRLAEALPFAPLVAIARVFLPLGLLAWTMAAAGLVRSWLRPSPIQR